ncbi:MAG TPA: zinc ribbon domain-containing protein [Fimbriimonas sp.]|nr:zinc ribbon domain-containing protein [Fimbriimonas sp.]
MPIYEYEPDDRECLMCEGKVTVIQGANDAPLKYCPDCGLEVRKIVSRASFQIGLSTSPDRAAQKGFTTWKKSESGVWEKLAGQGADVLVGDPRDVQAIKQEQKPKKVLDLDQGE